MTLITPRALPTAHAPFPRPARRGPSLEPSPGRFDALLAEAARNTEKNAAPEAPVSARHTPATTLLNASSVAARIPAGLRGRIPGIAALPRATSSPGPVTASPPREKASAPPGPPAVPVGPGTLASRFESGEKGPGAVGHDERGGTSYGLFQITSRTMGRFLKYLDTAAPQVAQRLRAAGPPDTGSASGAMPRVWRAIAAEDPEGFSNLQRDFIERSHYAPACRAVEERTGIAARSRSAAFQEVLFSTAVQHGPAAAARIVARAAERLSRRGEQTGDEALVKEIYAVRARRFGSSSPAVRRAVTRRLEAEKTLALAMLRDGRPTEAA